MMKDTGRLYLNIDYKMSGVGSNSCGPKLADEYLLLEREFSFTMRIKAISKDDNIFDIHRSQSYFFRRECFE